MVTVDLSRWFFELIIIIEENTLEKIIELHVYANETF